jgi:outer membrane lipoprotein carrier protein
VKRSLAALFFLWASPSAAYELDQVLANIERADKSVHAIKFDFVQDVRFVEMGSASVVKGEAMFAKPNRMRIQKKLPDEQLTVSDGKKMWVYNPAFKQVWEGTWKGWVQAKAIPPGLIPVGGYVADLRKRFNLSLAGPAEEGVRLEARPKEKDLGYSLEISVSTATWLPSETVYKSETAEVRTALHEIRVNPDIKDSDFSFKAPSGVDVIPLN